LQRRLDDVEIGDLADKEFDREAALEDIKLAAPRLLRLAQSEALEGDLMERVLRLNDRMREVLMVTGREAAETHPKDSEPTKSSETKANKNLERSANKNIFVDSVCVNGKRFARVLNASDRIINSVMLRDEKTEQVLAEADFLLPEETWTVRVGHDSSYMVLVDNEPVLTE
jgi:hypothetical protein